MNDEKKFIGKIYSEGYCCLYGYLTLCRARGEQPIEMAINLNIDPQIIWYQYRNLKHRKLKCAGINECLGPITSELEQAKKIPRE